MKGTKYDQERLLFRRQFTLGPRFLEGFPNWKRISVRTSVHLTIHPDLPVHRVDSGNLSIILLGYILDPYRPEAGDEDTIRGLLRHLESGGTLEDVIKSSHPLGGRWILIVDDGQDLWLFNDPLGYRQVFYTCNASVGLWCASQPGILAHVLGLAKDPDAMSFIQTFARREPQYWWPGDTTPYKEVHHLLPNHRLNLRTWTCDRYWPDGDLVVRAPEEVAAESAQLLRGLMLSASRRFELALAITAGRDTRLLLAASKAICHQLYLFTGMYWDRRWDSPDIRVPSRLLSRFGLPHHVIRCPPRMQREFKTIYRRNVATARDIYGAIAQGFYQHYPRGRVCVKGNGMEIIKGLYRSELRRGGRGVERERVDAQTLAWLTKTEEAFAVDAFDRWLSGVEGTNIDVLDLFRWENREGNWQAMSQQEWDIVFETFVPYNCRLFLINMLSVPEQHRAGPSYQLQEKMTIKLWPEVLSEPINPLAKQTVLSTARKFLRGIIHRVIRRTKRMVEW